MTHNSLEGRKGKKRVTIASSSQIKDVLLEEEIELREQQQQQQHHQRRLLEASTTDQVGSCSSSSSTSSTLKGRRVRIREDSSNSTEEQQHLDEGDNHLPGVIRRRRDQEEEAGNFGRDNGELQQPDGMEREGWVNHHQNHYMFHGVTTTGSINHGAGGSSSQNGTADATLASAFLSSSSSVTKRKTSIGVEDGVNSNPMNTASTSAVMSSMSYDPRYGASLDAGVKDDRMIFLHSTSHNCPSCLATEGGGCRVEVVSSASSSSSVTTHHGGAPHDHHNHNLPLLSLPVGGEGGGNEDHQLVMSSSSFCDCHQNDHHNGHHMEAGQQDCSQQQHQLLYDPANPYVQFCSCSLSVEHHSTLSSSHPSHHQQQGNNQNNSH